MEIHVSTFGCQACWMHYIFNFGCCYAVPFWFFESNHLLRKFTIVASMSFQTTYFKRFISPYFNFRNYLTMKLRRSLIRLRISKYQIKLTNLEFWLFWHDWNRQHLLTKNYSRVLTHWINRCSLNQFFNIWLEGFD